MANNVLIPKAPTCKRNVDPMPAWGRDVGGVLFIRCACGMVLGMSEHSVDVNGNVTPSLWHDDNGRGCQWHVMGTFEGWKTDPDGLNYKPTGEA